MTTYAPVSAAEHLAGRGWSIRPSGDHWAWFAAGRKGHATGHAPSQATAERAAVETFERLR